MDQRLRLVTLGVRDLPAARAFYVDGAYNPGLTVDPDGTVRFIETGA